MTNQSNGRQGGMIHSLGVLILAVIAILLAIQTFRGGAGASDKLEFHTTYQAVLLSNGLAYFGKVESQNGKFITLSDVYYIRSGANKAGDPKTQQNVLVKRGKEWHEPDRMTINLQSIVFIEPVAPASTVGKLIDQSKAKGE
jgi:hypothetical protein